MEIFCLFPNDAGKDDVRWEQSSHCGPLLVRAKDEIEARLLAGARCNTAAIKGETPDTQFGPWAASEGLACCEKYDGEEYEADGEPDILKPANLRGWFKE